ncbi:MAG: UpxY family transcription antiterminator [Desulfobacteraceae bacterium]|nr:UpxY family transcription antiterminator [Desulfobacteraceae bacterium]
MNADVLIRKWYVLYTKSRFENVVDLGLHKKSIEAFLPKIKKKSIRRDRRVVLEVPLFPGYLFVRTDLHPREHLDILKTVGSVHIIGNKEGPIPVHDDTIASLQIMVSSGSEIMTGRQLKQGDPVMVVRGVFVGVVGRFIRYRGKSRVIVDVDALGQSAGIEIAEEDVELLPEIDSNRLTC